MTAIPMGDLVRHHAGRKPADAPCLVYPGESLSWRELDERANRRARRYRALGVAKDDRVALALPNGPAFHEAALAIWKLGATPAVLPPRLPEREFDALADLISPRLVVGRPPDAARRAADWVAGDADAGAFDPEPIESEVARHWKAMTSGGSTGRPKVIVDHMPATFDPVEAPAIATHKLRPDSVMLNPGPLYHNGPFLFTSLALFTGSTVVGMERFDAEEALRLIATHRVTWVCLVPTMMHRIWSLPAEVRARYDLSSLEVVWHMAAPCPKWLKTAWIEWLGPERIWERYAGTEGYGSAIIGGEAWLQRPGSVGQAAGGAQVRVVAEDGSECAPGEVGELYFLPAGGAAPSHYLGAEPKRDARGWFSLGDLGRVDADGYIYLSDRRTDLIVRGGANIYPAEVEAVLDEHPDVASSIVIGLPSEDLGARVHAIVEPRAGRRIDRDDLHAFLAARLARYKLPESYEFVARSLRDDAGKARRSALRLERLETVEPPPAAADTV